MKEYRFLLPQQTWKKPENYIEDLQDGGIPGRYLAGMLERLDLYSLIAWDHVSQPGNDYYGGARAADEGVKAAATDAMRVITGIQAEYDRYNFKYQPPKPFHTWAEVETEREILLQVENNFLIYPS